MLALHAWGTADPARFAWFDPPPPERLAAAERLLVMLGGLAGSPGSNHPSGEARCSRSRSIPGWPGCWWRPRQDGRGREGATIAALLSERDIQAPRLHRRLRPTRQTAAIGLSDILDRLDMLA